MQIFNENIGIKKIGCNHCYNFLGKERMTYYIFTYWQKNKKGETYDLHLTKWKNKLFSYIYT